LTKFTAASELCDALRAAARGETFLGSRAKIIRANRSQRLSSQLGESSLTARQSQVLKLIAEGRANKQIASELSISIKTVEKHRQEVMDKLGIHNTAGLTRYAVEFGLVGTSDPINPNKPFPNFTHAVGAR
jgi:DNA-binding NarL/FixJ family response regulator